MDECKELKAARERIAELEVKVLERDAQKLGEVHAQNRVLQKQVKDLERRVHPDWQSAFERHKLVWQVAVLEDDLKAARGQIIEMTAHSTKLMDKLNEAKTCLLGEPCGRLGDLEAELKATKNQPDNKYREGLNLEHQFKRSCAVLENKDNHIRDLRAKVDQLEAIIRNWAKEDAKGSIERAAELVKYARQALLEEKLSPNLIHGLALLAKHKKLVRVETMHCRERFYCPEGVAPSWQTGVNAQTVSRMLLMGKARLADHENTLIYVEKSPQERIDAALAYVKDREGQGQLTSYPRLRAILEE
jgi:hypothetical protein